MIFETHAHYEDGAFAADREALIKSLPVRGISPVVNVGSSLETSRKSVQLADKVDFIYAAVGLHPDAAEEAGPVAVRELEQMAADPKVVAVGEIGLDYHWPDPPRDVQKKAFAMQLEMAARLKLPVIIHSRDAEKDTEDMLRSWGVPVNTVLHCYSYSVESAENFLKMGLYFGIGGALTFKKTKKLIEVVKRLPADCILLETDCPYMAPEPVRGTRNSSLNLPYVARKIAEIRGVTEEEVIRVTAGNARRFFHV
ncbi:MAG: TatD family hydrolase [Lachnospiraceae bacterium]|jgi:TatD DNase family protein|nr:TatD family hydrolase [Lachnospiraceae bacterium]MCH4032206.1 TatD family hydrolase [Lachnospiraceae bacterium]MCH4108916.1 TatD family hydrolase [Lachnospiraceae bacterium]MCI1332318.1 TatD family hydrolase [Lachnospiraceae bacterium]MCI1361731.1 TatD family hydrolase [Lachnospiraceae bacterium]